MSQNKLVSIHVPIVDAMEFLHIDHDKLIPLFTRYATIAEKQIGSAAQYELKRKVIDINQCTACLPNDCVIVEIGLLGDHGENCDNLLRSICSGVTYPNVYGTVNNTFLVVDMNDNGAGITMGSVPFTIQNNKLIFETSNYSGKKMTVQYLAYKTDCDGFMEVGENHVDAIRWYIVWMYLMGKTGINSLEYGKMNTAREEWNRECSHARAMDSIPSPSDRKKIVGMMHDPHAGISLSEGMFTTLGGMYNIW